MAVEEDMAGDLTQAVEGAGELANWVDMEKGELGFTLAELPVKNEVADVED